MPFGGGNAGEGAKHSAVAAPHIVRRASSPRTNMIKADDGRILFVGNKKVSRRREQRAQLCAADRPHLSRPSSANLSTQQTFTLDK